MHGIGIADSANEHVLLGMQLIKIACR